MYGMNVHRAVCKNKEKESGITIHLVNEEYDRGEILFQARCRVLPDDLPEDVQKRVQVLSNSFNRWKGEIRRWGSLPGEFFNKSYSYFNSSVEVGLLIIYVIEVWMKGQR